MGIPAFHKSKRNFNQDMNSSEFPGSLPPAGMMGEIELAGPCGALQTLVAMPRSVVRASAVICHPHPLHGGTMANKVVYTLASTARKYGLLAVRFNFRGVEKSAGEYDSGRGETEDTLAVVDWLRKQLPSRPVLLAGFSFGAYVSLRAAERAQPDWLISVSIPLGRVRSLFGEVDVPLPPSPQCPWLAVHSRDDEVVDYEQTRHHLMGYKPPPQLVTLEGAGHFYHGRLMDLQNIIQKFFDENGLSL